MKGINDPEPNPRGSRGLPYESSGELAEDLLDVLAAILERG
jgi:hypothetical protein